MKFLIVEPSPPPILIPPIINSKPKTKDSKFKYLGYKLTYTFITFKKCVIFNKSVGLQTSLIHD